MPRWPFPVLEYPFHYVSLAERKREKMILLCEIARDYYRRPPIDRRFADVGRKIRKSLRRVESFREAERKPNHSSEQISARDFEAAVTEARRSLIKYSSGTSRVFPTKDRICHHASIRIPIVNSMQHF